MVSNLNPKAHDPNFLRNQGIIKYDFDELNSKKHIKQASVSLKDGCMKAIES